MSSTFFMEKDREEVYEFQSVSLAEDLQKDNPDWNMDDIHEQITERDAKYCNIDNWIPGIVKDDAIYISVTNEQHQSIVDFTNGKKEELGNLGLGFFTDEATVNAAWTPDGINNTKLNEMCQIAPFHEVDRAKGIDEYNYKPHLDRFVIDHDRLEEVYGTREFPAMVSKCLSNDANSPGGGNQGYNRLIDEMIEKRVLKHDPTNSYSREDRPLVLKDGTPVSLNEKGLTNNTITKRKFERFQERVKERGQDCINNNTRHPSSEVCKNTKAPGESVKIGAEPCVLGTEPEKKIFWEKLQKYMKDYFCCKKEFTCEDEKQLKSFCMEQLKKSCKTDAIKPAGMQARDYMCNENVKNVLRGLEGISPDQTFRTESFCEDTAKQFQYLAMGERNISALAEMPEADVHTGGNSLKSIGNKIDAIRTGKKIGRNIGNRVNDIAQFR